jgi:hypothetical protein
MAFNSAFKGLNSGLFIAVVMMLSGLKHVAKNKG